MSLRRWTSRQYVEWAALYRSACADLALAEQGDAPAAVVDYLHQLVARAHNLFYRTRKFRLRYGWHALVEQAPRLIFASRHVHVAALLFWLPFLIAFHLAGPHSPWPEFSERVVDARTREMLEESFSQRSFGRGLDESFAMVGYYIANNVGIALRCFAGGLLFVPGLFILVANAVYIGAVFGWMSRPEVAAGTRFFEFVVAHGPWELTAVILSAAAGLRLGIGWVAPGRQSRAAAIQVAGREALPLIGTAVVLFCGAAVIEALISPWLLPYSTKALVAVVCSTLLMAYFVFLGGRVEKNRAT